MGKADVLVITPTQFGEGNLRNLDAAEKALEEGKPTIFFDNGQNKERDFTKGKATKYIEELKNKGATTIYSIPELLGVINDLETKNNKAHSKNI